MSTNVCTITVVQPTVGTVEADCGTAAVTVTEETVTVQAGEVGAQGTPGSGGAWGTLSGDINTQTDLVDLIAVSSTTAFDFVEVNPDGTGDYLTIDAAYTAGKFKIFLSEGVHDVSTALPLLEPNSVLEIAGAGEGVTTINFVNGNSATRYLAKGRDLTALEITDSYGWPTGGTYTLDGNTFTCVGLTYPAGHSSLAEMGWAVGMSMAYGRDLNEGIATIISLTEGAGTATIIVDRVIREHYDDPFGVLGDATYLWPINAIKFTMSDLTITGTGITAAGVLVASVDGYQSFSTHIHDVGCTDNFYFAAETKVVHSAYMNNVNVNGFEAIGTMGRVDNSSFGQTYGKLGQYCNDVVFSACSFADVGDLVASPWDNIYCQFIACTFEFDISAYTYFGKSALAKAKLVHCIDANGMFKQADSINFFSEGYETLSFTAGAATLLVATCDNTQFLTLTQNSAITTSGTPVANKPITLWVTHTLGPWTLSWNTVDLVLEGASGETESVMIVYNGSSYIVNRGGVVDISI